MDIVLKPQEENTGSQFNGQLVATRNFIETFGENAELMAMQTLQLIRKERVPIGADYLQVCSCKQSGREFWMIDDGDVVTALMPEDY